MNICNPYVHSSIYTIYPMILELIHSLELRIREPDVSACWTQMTQTCSSVYSKPRCMRRLGGVTQRSSW